jgi:exopolyphosphatase/pppGpp-phosphohydrolase
MIAGSVLVNTLARLLDVKEFIVSKRGIRQGMILDFIDKHRKML